MTTDELDLLHLISIISITMAVICALAIAVHIAIGNRERMLIMNLVWPITAWYSGPLGLAYFMLGRTFTNHGRWHDPLSRFRSGRLIHTSGL